VTTPILQHVDLAPGRWFPAPRGRAQWVFRLRSSDVLAGDGPPPGAVEGWLVDLTPHAAVVTFHPPDHPVEVRFGWAVDDPAAVVRAGITDVEAVCGEFLLGAVPGTAGSADALQAALNRAFGGMRIEVPGGLLITGLKASARYPGLPIDDDPATGRRVTGAPDPGEGDPLPPDPGGLGGYPGTGPIPPDPAGFGGYSETRPVPPDPAGLGGYSEPGPVEGLSGARPYPEPARYGVDEPAVVVAGPHSNDREPWWRRLSDRLRSLSRRPTTAVGPTDTGADELPPDPFGRIEPADTGVDGLPPDPFGRAEPADTGVDGQPDDPFAGTEPGEPVIFPFPARWPTGSETGVRPGEAATRQLVAQMPAGVPTGETVGLQVRIVGAAYDGPVSAAAPLMRAMPVRAGGTPVTVVVHAASGLVADGPLLQSVLVPETGDSDPVLFAFRAVARGLHKVDVKAYAGGSFLGELRTEVSVEVGGRRIDAPAKRASIGSLAAVPGEVTLQVQADATGQYVFQVLSDRTQFSPVPVSLFGGPAVEQVLGALSRIARGADYTGRNAREWLRQSGVNLWNQLVPDAVKEQFWQVRESMSAFTIATGHDVVPWELLYPLRPGDDDGFLIEQVPVVRRVFDQARSAQIGLGSARFVVPSESPADALAEVAAVAARIGGVADPVIDELDELLDLLSRGALGMAHFACHNNYRAEAGGSSIRLRNGAFQPVMLSAATVERSLARHRPLIFINACRSAGEVPQYTQMMGWAKQFMAAGAGAFVGTLWDIRSRSAAAFADGFYQRLADGRTLGQATHETRLDSARDAGDPTWLAYSVYGDPAATARGDSVAPG
jgi:hypothetical protein